MPNWSMNTIAIKGKKADVVNWLNVGLPETKVAADMNPIAINVILSESNLTLASFDPQADPSEQLDKVNLGAWMVDELDDELVVYFDCQTAWSWPHRWLETMQTDYSNLTFFCLAVEDMGDYNGYFCMRDPDTWVNHLEGGECVEDVDCDVDDYDAAFYDDFAADLSGEFEEYVLNYRLEDHTYISPIERRQNEERAKALYKEAYTQVQNQQYEDAEKNYSEVLALYRQLDVLNPQAMGLATNYLTMADLFQKIAETQYNMHRFEEAVKNYTESLSLWRKLDALRPQIYTDKVPEALFALATAQHMLHRYEDAKKNYSEALALFERNPDEYSETMDVLKQWLSLID